jgi:hypothetical protein
MQATERKLFAGINWGLLPADQVLVFSLAMLLAFAAGVYVGRSDSGPRSGGQEQSQPAGSHTYGRFGHSF